MTSSAANAGFNLATLTADARALINADKQACLIRWKVRDLKGPEKDRQGRVLLAAVPESARPAVVAALKARGSR
ncbi:hypothetical protein [Stutzerimonas stutzeri]|uniref:Uncharacterized protein n=1 Tax=Stutzerimonas stutzeri TaxID=316 RepID=A0A172WRQ0_STUST|nr:hypothetical protein [Stutzerimonas stutzeri]ANF26017.1 hypothetical protein PS273GM_13125 [Stutzerimonas stutzeri]